jgi:hypothetical protein
VQGCGIPGKAEFQVSGPHFDAVKAKFSWARAALVVHVDEAKPELRQEPAWVVRSLCSMTRTASPNDAGMAELADEQYRGGKKAPAHPR